MRNPVTGKIHRAIIELPTGFESNRLETSSLKNMFADNGFQACWHLWKHSAG
jgi:hypothetical protein